MDNQGVFQEENWLKLTLTEAQLFELETIKRSIAGLSRESLEALALEAVRQKFAYLNAFKFAVKKGEQN